MDINTEPVVQSAQVDVPVGTAVGAPGAAQETQPVQNDVAPANAVQEQVQEQVQEPVQEPVQDKPAVDVYTPAFEDPLIRAVEDMFVEKSVASADVNAAFAEAFKTGDVNKTDVAKLTELIGAANTALAMNSLRAYQAQNEAKVQRISAYCHTQFGGEAATKQAVAWINANLEHPTVGAELKALSASLQDVAIGEVAAKATIDALVTRYKAHANVSRGVQKLETPDTGATGGSNAPFGNRIEFAEAMQKAQRSGDPNKVNAVKARFAVSTALHVTR